MISVPLLGFCRVCDVPTVVFRQQVAGVLIVTDIHRGCWRACSGAVGVVEARPQ